MPRGALLRSPGAFIARHEKQGDYVDNSPTLFFYSQRKIIILGMLIMALYIVSSNMGLRVRRNDPCTHLELARRFTGGDLPPLDVPVPS